MKKYTTVAEILDDLSPDKRKQVEALRDIIMVSGSVSEHVKWNSPSYVHDNEDRITFNLHGSDIKILIHMGATRKEDKNGKPILDDATGIVTWSSDIRGIISFKNMDDISTKRLEFIDVLKRWLAVD